MPAETKIVKIIDNAINRSDLLALTEHLSLNHFAQLFDDGFPFFRTTFWYPLERAPVNIFETIARSLMSQAEPDDKVIGIEWWFSVMQINATPQWLLNCHFDRDDIDEQVYGSVRHPEIASVWYLTDAPYGELVVTDQRLTARGRRPRQPKEMDFVLPVRNRYVVFPGSHYHGVIGRMWRPLQPDTLRVSMAVNGWAVRPSASYLQDSRHCMEALRLMH